MEPVVGPRFKRANKLSLIILLISVAVLVCFILLLACLNEMQLRLLPPWFGPAYMGIGLIVFVTALVNVPISLAGLVCSRKNIGALSIAGVNCLVSITVLGLFVNAYLSFTDSLRNTYTSASAASLVIEHMRTHDGQWPHNWDELHETFLAMGEPWGSWDDLQDRTEIDFQVDPAKLVKMQSDGAKVPFCVIWARKNKVGGYPRSIDPNRQVFEYLHSEYAVQHMDTKELTQPKIPQGE